MTRLKPATPIRAAEIIETINNWPDNVRLLVVQCVVRGDTLVVDKTGAKVTIASGTYPPLPRPDSTAPQPSTPSQSQLWTPDRGAP